jgi:YHS domain-containing protein
MATDPVCGMKIDENTAPAKAEYQGRTFYFCSEECKAAFQQQPARYARQPATQS